MWTNWAKISPLKLFFLYVGWVAGFEWIYNQISELILAIKTLSAKPKLGLSLAKFIDMHLLINIINFPLLSLVKLGYFTTCLGG